MSTQVWKKFAQAVVPTVYTTIYTVPAGKQAIIQAMDVANTVGVTVACFIHLVPVSGAADTSNPIVYNVDIAARGVLSYTGIQVLNAGDFISVKGSAAGLVITVSGLEVTL